MIKPLTFYKKRLGDRLFVFKAGKTSLCYMTAFLMFLLSPFIKVSNADAQTSTGKVEIIGTVKDNSGLIPGVTIKTKAGTSTTTTDKDGRFKINVPALPVTLVFSSVGYTSQEKLISTNTPVNIVLKENAIALDGVDIVAIGYGTARKSDLTGATSSISTKNTDENAYGNFQQGLVGKAAGVVVTENSGAPGSGLSIEIRGQNSINGTTQPLYVVDGIPMEIPNTGALVTTGAALGLQGNSPLAAINPNDIANVEILKDASATAIYGSRGSNGVVLITTKRGKSGATKISMNVSNGFSKILKKMNVLGSTDYANLQNEIYKNQGFVNFVPYLPSEIADLPFFDHQKDISQTARTTDANLSVSGGDTKSNFYLSGQYFDQQGLIIGTKLKRYNFNFSYQNQLSTKLQLTSNINYTNTFTHGNVSFSSAGGLMNSALVWSPTTPFLNPDGTINPIRTYHYGTTMAIDPTFGTLYYNPRFGLVNTIAAINPAYSNPLSYINGVTNDNTSNQLLGNLTLNYKIVKNLTLNGVLGVTTYNSLLENYVPTTVPYTVTSVKGYATLGNLQSVKMLYQSTLTYDSHYKKHNYNVVAGVTAEKYTEKTQYSFASNFSTDATGANNIASGTVVGIPNSNVNSYALFSTLFRASYNYNWKYYLTLSGRYDGSSKFADNNKFGFFPSIGASWRVIKEDWFKEQQIFSEFKIRASYGMVGNQAVGPYSTLATLSASNTFFGGGTNNAGFVPSRLPNANLQWEKTISTNLGLDVGIVKDRIVINADIYNRETSNLIYNIVLPGTSGFTTMPKNIASIQNRGLEIGLNTVNIRSKFFTWTTYANIAFNQNKVLKLTGTPGEFLGINQVIGTTFLSRLQEGQPIGQFFGLKRLEVWTPTTILTKPSTFQATAIAGDLRYADLNNDGLLTDADRTYLGSALPKFAGGFGTTISYKNFDLSAAFSYSYGNKVFNQLAWTLGAFSLGNNTLQDVYDKRYIPITATTDPALVESITANNNATKVQRAGSAYDQREVADYYVQDGSFIRCKDITLNYNITPAFAKKLKIAALGIYLNAQNVFTITNYKGFNPEVNTGSGLSRGLDNGTYPIARALRIGIKAGF